MAGTTFLAHEQGVRDAVLAFGGASLAKILDGSANFGPVIAAGLAGYLLAASGGALWLSYLLGAGGLVVEAPRSCGTTQGTLQRP